VLGLFVFVSVSDRSISPSRTTEWMAPASMKIAVLSSRQHAAQLLHTVGTQREREREMGESRKKDDNNKGIEQTGRETRRKGRNLYYNMLH
jgi:hypothetical protein